MPQPILTIILPTPNEMDEATKTHDTVPLSVEKIDEFPEPIRIGDTYRGNLLRAERDHLLARLREGA